MTKEQLIGAKVPTSVTLPELGESVTEGTVTRWLKNVGDSVSVDEPLVEISTDKVDTEIPSPAAGVLLNIAANEDDIVEVGGLLAEIGDSAATPATPPSPPAQAPPAATPAPPSPAPTSPEPPVAAAPATNPPATTVPAAAPAAPRPSASATSTDQTEIKLPELGESVTEGTITRWLKSVGDRVEVDDPIVEVSTDKVDTEIPSPTAGVITRIAAQEDDIVAVGGLLATIGSQATPPPPAQSPQTSSPVAAPSPAAEPSPASEPVQAAPTPTPAPEPVQAAPTPSVPEPAPPSAPEPAPPITPRPVQPPSSDAEAAPNYVTPLVRKLARELDVDLGAVTGTGVGGRIRRQDIVAAAAAAKPTPQPTTIAAKQPEPATDAAQLRGKTEKLSRLRRIIADRMLHSLQSSAQLTTVVEVDVTRIAALRQLVKDDFAQREGVKLSFLPFFAKATVEALKTHPVINASLDLSEGTVTYHAEENLGVAVDTERGLLVPVIKQAGELNIAGLARRIAELAERTRTNRVTPDELGGGTFTLTNTGSRGALFDTPILNQPQVAILGTGSVVKRPVIVTGPDGGNVIGVRSMMYLALTYDHRLVDGADAARFLNFIKGRLEQGDFAEELGG